MATAAMQLSQQVTLHGKAMTVQRPQDYVDPAKQAAVAQVGRGGWELGWQFEIGLCAGWITNIPITFTGIVNAHIPSCFDASDGAVCHVGLAAACGRPPKPWRGCRTPRTPLHDSARPATHPGRW